MPAPIDVARIPIRYSADLADISVRRGIASLLARFLRSEAGDLVVRVE
jgi:hypothetical protein